jgi:hypothetical protein
MSEYLEFDNRWRVCLLVEHRKRFLVTRCVDPVFPHDNRWSLPIAKKGDFPGKSHKHCYHLANDVLHLDVTYRDLIIPEHGVITDDNGCDVFIFKCMVENEPVRKLFHRILNGPYGDYFTIHHHQASLANSGLNTEHREWLIDLGIIESGAGKLRTEHQIRRVV